MKLDKKVKRKKKGNGTIIITAVVVLLLAGIGYGVYGSQKTANVQSGGNGGGGDPLENLKEIRQQIDSEYGQKGMATNTPPIEKGYKPILSPRKADNLPDYVYTNAITLNAYKFAAEHPEVLEQMACYCGCGEHGSDASDGKPHRFLRDCFINDKGQFDSHAAYCDICVGINIKAQSAAPQGLPAG